ncbi:DUF3800 domain-containing protein [Sphaerospermopsis kisseleviana CS-549]|uniref:DUF3800 domain-containing protein n=1 Tax=Sphaerospermopsis kisseleviana CS-549 TaxID=3021783 RepID=A0ABT4ZR88_9CYAN|nr:DUF3800 domain-containing protein [Sphaerospermopsis kisseleviana]MDB9441916.1 DUF3800 domain-containing protein [Sphaerospermopsis kisseleviana CS-549]BAZ80447.1 hypothetical protein NIES73_17020 [Sphaerospermopsis kisseleviana NIES-73]
MFLIYIDESGSYAADDRTNYFILASIAIHETNYSKNYEQISQLKRSIVKKKEPEDWELKGHDLCKGKELFKGWNFEARVRTFLCISETLNQIPCHILSVVVNKKLLFENREAMKDDVILYQFAFQNLLDRLDIFLKSFHESGILFLDSRSTHSTSKQDDRLVRAYRGWLNSCKYDCNFIEQPWLGASGFYVGLQLADYVAYLISLKTQNIQEDNRNFAFLTAFDIIQEKIHLVEIPENYNI